MYSAETTSSTASRARVAGVQHYEIPDKNHDMHSAETRVTFSDDHYDIQDQNSHIHSLTQTLQLFPVTRVTISDDHYETQDQNRDMHSAETKFSTVSRARVAGVQHYEIPDKNHDMHSAETRVTFSDDHYDIQDQNSHIHSAGYISTQWPASARMY